MSPIISERTACYAPSIQIFLSIVNVFIKFLLEVRSIVLIVSFFFITTAPKGFTQVRIDTLLPQPVASDLISLSKTENIRSRTVWPFISNKRKILLQSVDWESIPPTIRKASPSQIQGGQEKWKSPSLPPKLQQSAYVEPSAIKTNRIIISKVN